MSKKRSVTLDIGGQRLSLRTDREDAYIEVLADYVGQQLDELKQAAPRVNIEKLCLMVALQIADELLAEREHNQVLQQEVERRSRALLEILDQELGTSSPSTWERVEAASSQDPRRQDAR